mmetsp:Transcript_15660/g.24362  ORF Transcript_15660/g.24362 Transcript_15660/m.24362 type:complete len:318 (+) Transcript_15660:86-1039(+)
MKIAVHLLLWLGLGLVHASEKNIDGDIHFSTTKRHRRKLLSYSEDQEDRVVSSESIEREGGVTSDGCDCDSVCMDRCFSRSGGPPASAPSPDASPGGSTKSSPAGKKSSPSGKKSDGGKKSAGSAKSAKDKKSSEGKKSAGASKPSGGASKPAGGKKSAGASKPASAGKRSNGASGDVTVSSKHESKGGKKKRLRRNLIDLDAQGRKPVQNYDNHRTLHDAHLRKKVFEYIGKHDIDITSRTGEIARGDSEDVVTNESISFEGSVVGGSGGEGGGGSGVSCSCSCSCDERAEPSMSMSLDIRRLDLDIKDWANDFGK